MIKVTFNCARQDVDALEQALDALGACSLVISPSDDEEIFEPELNTQPLWKSCIISAFFDDTTRQEVIESSCSQISEDFKLTFEITRELKQDWSTTWQKDFSTMHFGQRLVIHPSHDTPEKLEQFSILLDPGLAFGTGKHQTTALCLEWLDANVMGGESVIDYGCGSGILAIAAQKLGAKNVIAVDIDPQAVRATEDNCEKNHITDIKIFLVENCPKDPVDIFIANILANPLIEMAEQFAQLVKPKGKIALSGILASQANAVMSAYQPFFEIRQHDEKDDWVILAGERS